METQSLSNLPEDLVNEKAAAVDDILSQAGAYIDALAGVAARVSKRPETSFARAGAYLNAVIK